jgi:hypothetical protein
VGHGGARRHLAGDVALELGLAGRPQPADGLLEARAHGGVEALEGRREGVARHRDVVGADAVEAGGEVDDRLHATGTHGVEDRLDLVRGGLDVELGAGHARAVVDGRRVGAPQVDATDQGHGTDSRFPGGSARSRGPSVDTGD